MNGHAPRFRARRAHLNFSLIFVSVTLLISLSINARAQDLDEVSFAGVVTDAHGAVIDTTRTVAGGTVAREELERLPLLTRSPLDFVFLLGGVTEEPLSSLYS